MIHRAFPSSSFIGFSTFNGDKDKNRQTIKKMDTRIRIEQLDFL